MYETLEPILTWKCSAKPLSQILRQDFLKEVDWALSQLESKVQFQLDLDRDTRSSLCRVISENPEILKFFYTKVNDKKSLVHMVESLVEGRYSDDRTYPWIREALGLFQKPNLISNGIILDFDSPFVQETDPLLFLKSTPYEPYSDEEKAEAVELVDEALDILRLHAPNCHDFVGDHIKIMQFRKVANSGFHNTSSSMHVGEVIFGNISRKNLDGQVFAELMVHEAIHNFLYLYEIENSFYLNNGPERAQNMLSPWTSIVIDTVEYTHACIVWFALWHMYEVLGRASGLQLTPLSRERQALCAFGFRKNQALPEVYPYSALTMFHNPGFNQLLTKMQDDIRSRWLIQ